MWTQLPILLLEFTRRTSDVWTAWPSEIRFILYSLMSIGVYFMNTTGSTVHLISPYGKSQGPSFLTNLRCSGREDTLLDCQWQFVIDKRCTSHTNDMGVKCEGMTFR